MKKNMHGKKELEQKNLLRDNFLKEEYFQEAVKTEEEHFKMKYPDSEICKNWNKHGCRIIVYSR